MKHEKESNQPKKVFPSHLEGPSPGLCMENKQTWHVDHAVVIVHAKFETTVWCSHPSSRGSCTLSQSRGHTHDFSMYVPCSQCHRPWQVTSANHPMQNAQCHHWNLAAKYKRKRKKKKKENVWFKI